MRMRLALAIASFVVLIVHGLVFYDQFFHRWERHQTAYFEQARSLTKNEAERAELEARSPKIEQIIVTSFGDTRVDRCTTCHIAQRRSALHGPRAAAEGAPYSAAMGDVPTNGRWERRHKFADFGCTVCHDGQGRGLDNQVQPRRGRVLARSADRLRHAGQLAQGFRRQAQGQGVHGGQLRAVPHRRELRGHAARQRGRKLFYSMNCYGCHKIEGMSEGTLGPDLTEAGKKFKIDYLWESVVDPRANCATSFMPKFNLTDDEVRALVIFLKSRRGINFAETSLDAVQGAAARAAAVVRQCPPRHRRRRQQGR